MPPNLSDDKFAPVLGNVIILTNVWLVFNLMVSLELND